MKFATKTIISIFLLTATIIGIEIYVNRTLKTTSARLEEHISELENKTRSGNWHDAEIAMQQIEKDWDEVESSWAILIDHFEIDNIDTAISKLSVYVKSKETSLALAEASTLKNYVRHIPQKESFSVANIL